MVLYCTSIRSVFRLNDDKIKPQFVIGYFYAGNAIQEVKRANSISISLLGVNQHVKNSVI